jgi:Ca2+-binding RTX toxin-like protein
MSTATAIRYVGLGDRNESFAISSDTPIIIEAGGGSDFLWPDMQSDVLYGQGGRDLFWSEGGNDIIFGDYSADDSRPGSPGDGDSDFIQAGADRDIVFASVGNDFVNGESGDDYIDGGSGDDNLWGGYGTDTIHGGPGSDVIYGGTAGDVPPAANLIVPLNFNGQNNAEITDVKAGTGGQLAVNDLSVDYLDGETGNDTFFVDNALDVVVEGAGGGFDTVFTSTSFALSRYAEIEVLAALEPGARTPLNLSGSATSNVLYGSAGANVLRGLAGNDTFYAGRGKDIIYGGSGKDVYVFDTKPNSTTNYDRIRDFSVRDDTVRLDNAVFTKAGANGRLKASAFWVGSGAHDGNDRIIYNPDSGALLYDRDGTGAAVAVKFAQVAKHLHLSHKDFLII